MGTFEFSFVVSHLGPRSGSWYCLWLMEKSTASRLGSCSLYQNFIFLYFPSYSNFKIYGVLQYHWTNMHHDYMTLHHIILHLIYMLWLCEIIENMYWLFDYDMLVVIYFEGCAYINYILCILAFLNVGYSFGVQMMWSMYLSLFATLCRGFTRKVLGCFVLTLAFTSVCRLWAWFCLMFPYTFDQALGFPER